MADADAGLSSSAETKVHDPEPDLCAICHTELGLVNVVTTPCNHRFHWPCITPWQRSHNTCPFCRKLLLIVPDEPPEDGSDNASNTEAILQTEDQLERRAVERLVLHLATLDLNSISPSSSSESSRFFGHENKTNQPTPREYDPNSPPTRKGYTLSSRKKKKCRCGNCSQCRAKKQTTRQGYVLSPGKKKSPSPPRRSRVKKQGQKRGSKRGSRKAYEY